MSRRIALLSAAAFVSTFSMAACGGEPEEQPVREEQVQGEQAQGEILREDQTEEEVNEGIQERQQARYYGEEFAGSPTASGEPYDPYGLTTAHPHLPLGTELLVSYGDRSVIVTVNDRDDYGLDLSLGAAQALGLTDAGTAMVDVEVVEDQPSAA